MALAKRIAFNVAYNSVAKVISTVLALVSVGFITRYLGKEGFGNYSTVLAFFAFFSAAADLGIYSIATREISRSDANESRVMSDAFSLRLLISLAMLLIAPLIVWALPYSHEVSVGIVIAAATFVFASSYGLLNGLFQKHIAMNRVATAELVGKVIQVALVAMVVSKNLGFISIMLAFFLSTAITFAIVFVDSRKFTTISFRWSPAAWRVLIRESLPMGISVFVTFLYFKLDTILLSVMRPSADVGIYGVAYKVIENLTFFPGMVVGLVFPLFSRHIFSDPEQF
ncbi:hypothetical protein EPO05_02810, partial [Patescibacteria group bacterium]